MQTTSPWLLLLAKYEPTNRASSKEEHSMCKIYPIKVSRNTQTTSCTYTSMTENRYWPIPDKWTKLHHSYGLLLRMTGRLTPSLNYVHRCYHSHEDHFSSTWYTWRVGIWQRYPIQTSPFLQIHNSMGYSSHNLKLTISTIKCIGRKQSKWPKSKETSQNQARHHRRIADHPKHTPPMWIQPSPTSNGKKTERQSSVYVSIKQCYTKT